MSSKTHPFRGYLYIAAASLLWGVAATLGRAVFTGRLLPAGQVVDPIGPLILSQSRTTFSFLAFLPIVLLRSGWRGLALPLPDMGRTFLLGTLGIAASNFFYYLAIQRTNVATAIILQYTAPIWVLLYVAARGLQKPRPQQVAAVALAVVGIALAIDVFAGGLRKDLIGVTAALLAAFAFAFYNIAGHNILARHDRWTVLLYVTCSAAMFWMVMNPPWKIVAGRYSPAQWMFLAVFALVSALAPFSFYFAGLRHLEPTRAIIVSCLEPIFTIVIAAIALGEALGFLQAAGIALVLAAIVIVQTPERKTEEPKIVVEPIE